jgi:hypothetical protein
MKTATESKRPAYSFIAWPQADEKIDGCIRLHIAGDNPFYPPVGCEAFEPCWFMGSYESTDFVVGRTPALKVHLHGPDSTIDVVKMELGTARIIGTDGPGPRVFVACLDPQASNYWHDRLEKAYDMIYERDKIGVPAAGGLGWMILEPPSSDVLPPEIAAVFAEMQSAFGLPVRPIVTPKEAL